MPKGIKPQDLKPVWEEIPGYSGKLEHDLEQMANIARTSVEAGLGKLVDEKRFSSLINAPENMLIDSEKAALQDLAKTENGLYNTEAIDILREIRLASKNEDGEFTKLNLICSLKLLRGENGFDMEAAKKVVDFVKRADDKYIAINVSMIPDWLGNRVSAEAKKKLIDLCMKMHDRFSDVEEGSGRLLIDNLLYLFEHCFPKGLSVSEQFSRIEILSKIVQNVSELEPLCNISRKLYSLDSENIGLVGEFLRSKILPTKGVAKIFEPKDLKIIREFYDSVKPLTDLNVDFVDIDEYAIENILKAKDKTRLNRIIDFVKSENITDCDTLSIKENTIDLSKYICILENKSGEHKGVRYDKATGKLVQTTNANYGSIEIFDHINNRLINQKYNDSQELMEETITHFDKKGNIKFKEFTIPSNVPGQYDVYRQMPDGKIIVKAKSFRDPVTGEYKMVRNLTSPSGVTSKINYSESNDGSYTYDYVIKNKEGQIIDEIHSKYTIIDEKHSVSEVNGQIYDILRYDDQLIVTPKGKSSTILYFKDLFEYKNPGLVNTVSRLPGDELISLERMYVKIGKYINDKNACAEANRSMFSAFTSGASYNNINIGKEMWDSYCAFLHELGHLKFEKLTKEEFKQIRDVYNRELAAFLKESCGAEQNNLSYLIDTDHYLNDCENKGCIEEAVADIMAMRRVPEDKSVVDTGIRNLRFQEAFPETIACVNRIFNNKLL